MSRTVQYHGRRKVKEEQSEPSMVSSSRSALLGPDKTLQTDSIGVSLTRKPLDAYDPVEDVTSTDASPSEQGE